MAGVTREVMVALALDSPQEEEDTATDQAQNLCITSTTKDLAILMVTEAWSTVTLTNLVHHLLDQDPESEDMEALVLLPTDQAWLVPLV